MTLSFLEHCPHFPFSGVNSSVMSIDSYMEHSRHFSRTGTFYLNLCVTPLLKPLPTPETTSLSSGQSLSQGTLMAGDNVPTCISETLSSFTISMQKCDFCHIGRGT